MLVLLLTLFSLAARAEEGFYASPPPSALTTAWAATFLLFTDAGDRGVASAVAVRRQGDVVDLLTVNHALSDGCSTTKCEKMRLLRSVDLEWSDRRRLKDKSIVRFIEVVARDVEHDLAILRVRIPEAVEPIRIAARCDDKTAAAFAIGFPVTADRTSILKIQEPSRLRKRWSTGHFIGRAALGADSSLFFGEKENARDVLVTSVDAISGSSGGPLVNVAGEMIGLVDRTGGDNINYVGRDQPESSQFNAVATPCEQIRAFLATVRKN